MSKEQNAYIATVVLTTVKTIEKVDDEEMSTEQKDAMKNYLKSATAFVATMKE